MKHIKTVVFDLDGTIYQNNHFHPDYIHFLVEQTSYEDWEQALVSLVDDVFAGYRLVMNDYYCSAPIIADSFEAYAEKLEKARLPELTFETSVVRSDSIFLGDAWAVVSLIGSTLGLIQNGRGDKIYKKTREKMSEDGMVGNMRLKAAIEKLGKHYETVLLTNSYEQTALDFLAQLNFSGVFTKIVYSAQKPYGLVENLTRFCPELADHPETFLTIGDHAFNDLMPLQQLGAKALWINPFENIHEAKADLIVHTLDELAQCLERMC
ncbi:MAG: HAD family hydrolase, partial [Anaerotignum sp.]|nr:HAD family hydrolase [Anaerotignum sp.]